MPGNVWHSTKIHECLLHVHVSGVMVALSVLPVILALAKVTEVKVVTESYALSELSE